MCNMAFKSNEFGDHSVGEVNIKTTIMVESEGQISPTENPNPNERKRKCEDEIEESIPSTSVLLPKSPGKIPKINSFNVSAVLPNEYPTSHILKENAEKLKRLTEEWEKFLSEKERFEDSVVPSGIDEMIKAALNLEEDLKKQKEKLKEKIALFTKSFQQF